MPQDILSVSNSVYLSTQLWITKKIALPIWLFILFSKFLQG